MSILVVCSRGCYCLKTSLCILTTRKALKNRAYIWTLFIRCGIRLHSSHHTISFEFKLFTLSVQLGLSLSQSCPFCSSFPFVFKGVNLKFSGKRISKCFLQVTERRFRLQAPKSPALPKDTMQQLFYVAVITLRDWTFFTEFCFPPQNPRGKN